MNVKFMIVWYNGESGVEFHPQKSVERHMCLVSSPTLTPCLLVTKYRNRQQTRSGGLNRRCARNRRTQSLLPAPESGHCESSWHHLLLDVLSLPSRKQSHLISDDIAQFQSPWKCRGVWELVLLFPLPKRWSAYVKLQSGNDFARSRRGWRENVLLWF